MVKSFPVAMALIGVATPALAQSEVAAEWARSTPASQQYSIETPCSIADVQRDSAEPLQVGDQTLDEGSNVSCAIGETVFASGIVSVSEDEIGDENVYDVTIALLGEQTLPAGVNVTFVELDGHRALLSREQRGDEVAQTGIVELSNREMLMIISGGKPIDGMDMNAMIDRHVSSLKVTSK
jgi:hypothetical protein